jgi:hypothetical protein
MHLEHYRPDPKEGEKPDPQKYARESASNAPAWVLLVIILATVIGTALFKSLF